MTEQQFHHIQRRVEDHNQIVQLRNCEIDQVDRLRSGIESRVKEGKPTEMLERVLALKELTVEELKRILDDDLRTMDDALQSSNSLNVR